MQDGRCGKGICPLDLPHGKANCPSGRVQLGEVTAARHAGVNEEEPERGVNGDNSTMRV